MDSKPWYQSKIVWLSVITALISGLEIFSEWYSKGDFSIPGIISLIISILLIVVRVFFTSTVISR